METDGQVPNGQRPWVGSPSSARDTGLARDAALAAATAAWSSVSAESWDFTRAALGGQVPGLTWADYRGWLLTAAAVELPDAEGRLRVRGEWIDSSSSAAAIDGVAGQLLDHWRSHPVPGLAWAAVEWARRLHAWSALSGLWMSHLLAGGVWRTPPVIKLLAELPPEARREAPLLSMARAQARAEAVLDRASGERQVMADLLSDATAFHSKWRQSSHIDAVLLGTALCMLSQRATPGVEPASALELAWEAQQATAMTLERRRSEVTPATARAEAIFRATSAHNALARGDLEQAVIEADRAAMLDPHASLRIADGAGALARELMGGADVGAPREQRGPELDVGWHRDLTSADSTAAGVALALNAIRRVDRQACEQALASLGQLSPGAPMWTVVLFAEALSAALWGDAAAALTRHDTARAVHALASVEQREPLGEFLLGRARILLLDRLGASSAAVATAAQLRPEWRPLQEARSLLWAGDPEAALRVAESGLYEAAVWSGDRLSLRAVQIGARLLDRSASDSERAASASALMMDCLQRNTLLPIAMLPGELRSEIVAMHLANRDDAAVDPQHKALLAALQGVVATPGIATSTIALTRREKTLLPLLATADAVPEIAAHLHVSANTVRTQVANLRRKFGAKSRAELVRFARNAGLL